MKKAITITTIALLAILTFSFDTKEKKVTPKYGAIIITNKIDYTTAEFSYAGSAWWISGETIQFNDTLNRKVVLRVSDISAVIMLDSAHSAKRVIQ